MGGILFHRIDRIHQFTPCFAIKQAGKQNGLVKGWFHQHRFAFHITVLLDVMNDLLNERDLLRIQRFVVDELGKCLHGSIVVQLCHFTHQQTKGCIPKLPCIVLFAAQLTGKDMFQLGIVAPGKRNVLGQLVDVAFEWLYCKLLKKPNPISDLSAVVTGIILAMNVPVGMPIGQLIIGDLVAIVIVKQLFGGIGMNFANPALVGRIVLFISFAGSMNKWVFPDAAVDQLSSATPLAVADKSKLSLLDLFMGIHGGVLGETCALAIVLGLIYLVATKTISIAIPASYVGSMFVFYLIATHSVHEALVAVLSGGLLFGAVFMATDYVTSPFTLKGKLVYGVALGIVTFAIRYWGSYTEGVSFALLFMNLWVPYINDLTRQTPYGYIKPAKKAKEGAGK